MKKKTSFIIPSTAVSFALLKISQSRIDPYTRFVVGLLVGSLMAFSQNPLIRLLGIGVLIGAAIQILDVPKGGRLSVNKSSKPVFVLHESEGIKELAPMEVPNYNIDGFTVKGLNGVYKLSDGVNGRVSGNSSVGTAFGVGCLVNRLRKAGLKDSSWALRQEDKRWGKLFEMILKAS